MARMKLPEDHVSKKSVCSTINVSLMASGWHFCFFTSWHTGYQEITKVIHILLYIGALHFKLLNNLLNLKELNLNQSKVIKMFKVVLGFQFSGYSPA